MPDKWAEIIKDEMAYKLHVLTSISTLQADVSWLKKIVNPMFIITAASVLVMVIDLLVRR